MVQLTPRPEGARVRSSQLRSIVALAWVIAACSSSAPTQSTSIVGGPSQTDTVTIAGPGGSSVIVPPGASATPISVAVSQDATGAPAVGDGVEALSSTFAVTPHGSQFEQPVSVRIPFDSSRATPGVPLMVLKANPGGPWVPLTAVAVEGNMAEVQVTSFSLFVVVQSATAGMRKLAIEIDPLDEANYAFDLNTRAWSHSEFDARPALIPVHVTVAASPTCAADETLEILVSAQGVAQDGSRLSWVSPAGQGWSVDTTEIDLPLLASFSWRTRLHTQANSVPRYTWTFEALLVCTDSARFAHIQATSNDVQRTFFVRDQLLLGLGDGPQDVSAAVGERRDLALAVVGGTFIPHSSDQYTVEWMRSDDQGQTWSEASARVSFETEMPYDPHLANQPGLGGPPIHWSTFTTPPFRPEDDGALIQAHACYTQPGSTTPDCVFSRAARLSVASTSPPAFTADPQSVLVTPGSMATFTAAAAGAPVPSLQWQSLARGATSWSDIPGATGGAYTTAAVALGDNGTQFRAVATNTAGSATSRAALLDVAPVPVAPTIQVQPFDVSVAPGSTASFVVVAHGSDPLSYQWRRDGNAITGATGPRLDLPNVAVADLGAHLDVVVTNPAGSVTSTAATLTVSTIGPSPVAPTITQQPVSGTTTAPYPAMFAVVASGTPPLSYQWLLNGVAIPGANDASYGTPPTTVGSPPVTYSVVVWNAGGAVVSSGATLTVVAGAPLTVQSVTPAAGSTGNPSLATSIGATFSEILDCTSIDATSFQVVEGTNPVAGAIDCTGPTLTFTPSQPLPTRTTLRAHLGSGIRDKFMITLGAPYEWTFGMAPWTRQLGTAAHDEPLGLRTDGAGNVLLTGYTAGGLEGNTLTGIVDAFVVKLAPSGARLWARQIGAASAFTYGYGVGSDTTGNVYVAGHTNGTLPGNTSNGYYDLFLTKLDPAGNVLWTQQHGASVGVQVAGLAVDADGNSLVVGWTQGSLDGQTNAGAEDVFVVKYDTTGARVWTRMFGSSATDYATSIALDSTGNILVAGYTRGSIGGTGNAGIDDLFVLKLGQDGTLLWARQLGSSAMDQAWGVATDLAGSVYATGWTRGSLDGQTSHGGQDIVVVKWDATGTKQWTQQLGTAADDWAAGVTVDANGDLYVVGGTHGPLDGGSNTSATQLFAAKLSSGVVRWIFQEGGQPFGYDLAETVATDSSGNVFAAGITDGNLDGNTNAGDYDAFVVKVQQDGTPR